MSSSEKRKDQVKRGPSQWTGFIIFSSEIRDKINAQFPDKDFSTISKYVGQKWQSLPQDMRAKYNKKALMHNIKARLDFEQQEKEQRQKPKLSRRQQAAQAKHAISSYHLSSDITDKTTTKIDDNQCVTPTRGILRRSARSSCKKVQDDSYEMPRVVTFDDKLLQDQLDTTMDPNFKARKSTHYDAKLLIEKLIRNSPLVHHKDNKLLNLSCEWPKGLHPSPEDANRALQDIMTQDAITMRYNLDPLY